MKKFLVILFLFICFFECGFGRRNRPIIFYSTTPITKQDTQNITRILNKDQRIYFAIIVPKGLKKGVYRVQIVKKDEKSEFWGYKYCRHYDYKIEEDNTPTITDYFVLNEKGLYFIQLFNLENINKPIALGDFWVK